MGIWNAIPIVGDIINNIFDFADDNLLSKEEELTLQNARKIIEQKPQLIKLAIEKSQAEGRLKIALAQIEVNKEETKGNWFQRGWRPLIGWECGIGFGVGFIFPELVKVGFWLKDCIILGSYIPFRFTPDGKQLLIDILGGMLGIATLRTVEKLKGVQGKH